MFEGFLLAPQAWYLRACRVKIFLFVLVATVLEAAGDAIVRIALHHPSVPARIGLFLAGFTLLALYGTSLNLAPVDFATVTGMYVATLFVVFQITSFVFFRSLPTPAVLTGGAFIVTGGLIVFLWR
jgi:hypothetical protein